MKHITAYIQPHKLASVVHALRSVDGLTGMSAHEVKGFGLAWRETARYEHAGEEDLEVLRSQVKIDVVCRDEQMEMAMETIRAAAHTGLAGDGKIYVAGMEDALRIATGERGEAAV